MDFYQEEKIFSLARTSAMPPSRDITCLFEEFYCLLLVAGLFREGEGNEGVHLIMEPMSSKGFMVPRGSYNNVIANQLTKGLKSRFTALQSHPGLVENERRLLAYVDRLFDDNQGWTKGLTGTDLFGTALRRSFSPSMQTIARYVSVMFGKDRFAESTTVPKLYLAATGNIHLSSRETVTLGVPELPYGSQLNAGTTVTALWALLSAQLETLSTSPYPGDELGCMLSKYLFMTEPCNCEGSVPAPVYAASLYMRRIMGLDDYNPVAVSAAFYQSFLYGSTDARVVSRGVIIDFLLDLMVKKSASAAFDLFAPNSSYKKLHRASRIANKTPKQPIILRFALEALGGLNGYDPTQSDDAPAPKTKAKAKVKGPAAMGFDPTNPHDEDGFDPSKPTDDQPADPSDEESPSPEDPDSSPDTGDDTTDDVSDVNASDDPSTDPQAEDGGFDPANPTPDAQGEETNSSVNIIGLISFDKSGEGVDEDLYRKSVVALNNKLRADDSLPVATEAREALNYWVNGFLYRTAISSTKDYVTALKLQQYLK
jgi:hypothetical protein